MHANNLQINDHENIRIYNQVNESIAVEIFQALSSVLFLCNRESPFEIERRFEYLSHSIANSSLGDNKTPLHQKEKDAVNFVASYYCHLLQKSQHILMSMPLSQRQKSFQSIVNETYQERYKSNANQSLKYLGDIAKSDSSNIMRRFDDLSTHNKNGLRNMLQVGIEKVMSREYLRLNSVDFQKHLSCFTFLLNIADIFNSQSYTLCNFIAEKGKTQSVFLKQLDDVMATENIREIENMISLLEIILERYPFCRFTRRNHQLSGFIKSVQRELNLHIKNCTIKLNELKSQKKSILRPLAENIQSHESVEGPKKFASNKNPPRQHTQPVFSNSLSTTPKNEKRQDEAEFEVLSQRSDITQRQDQNQQNDSFFSDATNHSHSRLKRLNTTKSLSYESNFSLFNPSSQHSFHQSFSEENKPSTQRDEFLKCKSGQPLNSTLSCKAQRQDFVFSTSKVRPEDRLSADAHTSPQQRVALYESDKRDYQIRNRAAEKKPNTADFSLFGHPNLQADTNNGQVNTMRAYSMWDGSIIINLNLSVKI